MQLSTVMFPDPQIIYQPEKILVGTSVTMSMADNKTGLLWKSFMPRRNEIVNAVSADRYSLQVYPDGYFENFSAVREFTKWALVEISDNSAIPNGMEMFNLPAGDYAVFSYKGPAADNRIFSFIYNEWLPRSGYVLDNRPHFEVLGERYSNTDPASEEDIYIPIRPQLQ